MTALYRSQASLALSARVARSYRQALVEILDRMPIEAAPAIRAAWARAAKIRTEPHVTRCSLLMRQAG